LREDSLESREENENLRDKLTRAEMKSNQLEIELNETKKNENEAFRLAKNAKDDLGKVHESSLQWKKRTSELAAENNWCKDILEKLYQDILEEHVQVEPVSCQTFEIFIH
jgi:chromosome segregation ATPase